MLVHFWTPVQTLCVSFRAWFYDGWNALLTGRFKHTNVGFISTGKCINPSWQRVFFFLNFLCLFCLALIGVCEIHSEVEGYLFRRGQIGAPPSNIPTIVWELFLWNGTTPCMPGAGCSLATHWLICGADLDKGRGRAVKQQGAVHTAWDHWPVRGHGAVWDSMWGTGIALFPRKPWNWLWFLK